MHTLATVNPTIAEILTLVERGGKPTIEARILHSFMEVGRDFPTWINGRIEAFGFTEGEDFACLTFPKSGDGKFQPTEYHLSLDMAKELSMVERNAKGKEARQYFIECEKKLHAPAPWISYSDALRQLADKIEEAEQLKLTVAAQAPAVEFIEQYVKAEGLFGIRETAKVLGLKQNFFVSMLEDRGVMFRENGALQPYAKWIDAGHFTVKTGEANEHAFKQSRFTSRGVEWVRRYLKVNELLAMTAP